MGAAAYLVGFLDQDCKFLGAGIFSDPQPTLGDGPARISFIMQEMVADSYSHAADSLRKWLSDMAKMSATYKRLLEMTDPSRA